MWFAEEHGIIYISTDGTSGKVKRIRNSGHVTLAPCTASGKVIGEAIEGRARILSDTQEIARAEAALAKKYGLQRRIFSFLRGVARVVRRRADNSAYLAIEA
jgi:PPOX class probable F420-dependent enzyme